MPNLLDSRQLLAFSTLARVGSFTLAARELHLTQSAVSHAMKALEEEVGCRLFERGTRSVSLTPAGETLARHVARILEEMTAARASLDTNSVWGQGRLRVGASTTACQYILPAVLREFKESFPRCAISIEPGDHPRQLDLIGGNQVDLAIMLAPSGRRELSFVPLFDDELCFVVSPALVPARRGVRAALVNQTLILYNKTSFTFRLVSQYFQEEGLSLGHFIELGSMDAIKELVKIGVGVGVLAPWVVRAELESGALVSFPLGRRQLRRRWGVVHRRDRQLSLGEQTFIGLCRTVTENFGEPTDDLSPDQAANWAAVLVLAMHRAAAGARGTSIIRPS